MGVVFAFHFFWPCKANPVTQENWHFKNKAPKNVGSINFPSAKSIRSAALIPFTKALTADSFEIYGASLFCAKG